MRNADTEDYFHRRRLPAEVVEIDLREASLAEGGKARLESLIEMSHRQAGTAWPLVAGH